ncbi:hypothetical protein QQF64_014350 [Cirrhinus molitorella]|uniref:Uncharacterized protein n=1 Tax=Cirrhinus molitorella TaxID=172907 RepID=A0ABR3NRU4_9TELE
MINGDEIYSTFTKLRNKNTLVWLFSRMYIYTFVPVFTYMILSLFIALITDTYETIRHYQKHGAPLSELQAFIAECKDPPNSGKYMIDEESSTFWCLCAPCRKDDPANQMASCWLLDNRPANESRVCLFRRTEFEEPNRCNPRAHADLTAFGAAADA